MRIDVWADVVCPWCWIGETRLHRALGQRPQIDAQVVWRPFQLRPDLPREGQPWEEVIHTKFGGPERAKALFQHVAAAGAYDGLKFEFERIPGHPNTRDAHRLVLLAQREGRARQMAEAMFAANFTEGRDLGDREVLADIAMQVGMDRDRATRFLAGDELAREVDASQAEAAALGIDGVPFFVIDGKYAFSGAQSLETFVSVLDRVRGMEAAAD